LSENRRGDFLDSHQYMSEVAQVSIVLVQVLALELCDP